MAAPRLVVRTYAPLRRVLLIGGGLVIGLLALYIAFEWGRSRAGFDGAAAREQRSDLRRQISDLKSQLKEQRLQLARFETERVGQTRERTELEKTIGSLQADKARLTSDLAFYRGIAGGNTGTEVMKIQQFEVLRGPGQNAYVLRLVLGRPLRAEDLLTGKVRITVEGGTLAEPRNLDLAALAGIEGGELSFSYRYTETLEQPVVLPAGFTPLRTTVELAPARRGVNPVRESFIWTVQN